MYRFLIVIEKANGNFSAYSPDLPGCVATGKTRQQVTRNMHAAIEMHVRGMLEDKLPIPKERPEAPPANNQNEGSARDRPASISYQVNTNLEPISDWLTKILVGVGLTQISTLPGALQKYAH